VLLCLSNSLGFCDNFLSVGKSTIWNEKGDLVASLEEVREEVLIYDTF
jgi:hypothetical protein